jgi:hypothetical protein
MGVWGCADSLSPSKNGPDVARTVENPNDLHGVGIRAVDDQIGMNGPEADGLFGQVLAQVSHPGHCRKPSHRLPQLCHYPSSGTGTVAANEGRDLSKVVPCSGRENKAARSASHA